MSRGLGQGFANIQRCRLQRRRFWCQGCATVYRSPPRAAHVHAFIYGHRVRWVGIILTPREREVLVLVTEGKSTKEIAAVLGIGLKTAWNYLSIARGKL